MSVELPLMYVRERKEIKSPPCVWNEEVYSLKRFGSVLSPPQ